MQKITIFWRDIPSQIMVRKGRQRAKAMLSARFQEAIDRAAMRAGKGSSEQYLEDWRREYDDLRGESNMQEIATAAVQQLESSFTDEDLERLIRNKGLQQND